MPIPGYPGHKNENRKPNQTRFLPAIPPAATTQVNNQERSIRLLTTIKNFLLDLEIKGRAENTILNYKLHLRSFYSWCMQTGTDYLLLTPRQAKQYRDALYTTGLSGKSINTMIGTLRTFYEYLMEEELAQGNPVLKNLRVREEPKFPAPLNEEEQHILQETLESKQQYINLAFLTMLATDIRVGEAAKLTKKDLRLD